LGGHLPKLCPMIPTSNQDGHQAKNRKKGGWNKKNLLLWNYWANLNQTLLYVKLSSAVGAILVEGPNRRTSFWKRTNQWLFHQNLVLIEQMVSDKKIFMGIFHRVLC
jgi:hypothetical protein